LQGYDNGPPLFRGQPFVDLPDHDGPVAVSKYFDNRFGRHALKAKSLQAEVNDLGCGGDQQLDGADVLEGAWALSPDDVFAPSGWMGPVILGAGCARGYYLTKEIAKQSAPSSVDSAPLLSGGATMPTLVIMESIQQRGRGAHATGWSAGAIVLAIAALLSGCYYRGRPPEYGGRGHDDSRHDHDHDHDHDRR
jgi:hypothetical protein